MKVTRNNSNQLIVSYVPWLTGLSLIGFLMIFVASAAGGYFRSENSLLETILILSIVFCIVGFMGHHLVQRIQVIFDKPSDTVTIQRRNVLMTYQTETHKLSDFRCAEMQPENSQEGRHSCRPVLHFARTDGASSIPLINAYTQWSGQTHSAMALMNHWAKVNVVDSDSQSA
ncbi:hypothetical protein [Ruegeria faecimaris]|uniref:hypothetical protein n=1 Tax=Ruegeria faecimaris TaxID=686389 RepID=UPI00232E6FD6|nr:hypothetical protein [Ruegeria faecimaris]